MLKRRFVVLPTVLHIFNIIGQCLRVQCLTIDNHIVVAGNDCYGRISVGSKLSDADIVLRVDVTDLTECEEQCSKSEHVCNSFTFGVGVKGNGTCAISALIPVLENLEINPDYDVYVKTRHGSSWCTGDPSYGDFRHGNGNLLMKPNDRSNAQGHVTDVGGSSFRKSFKHLSSMPIYAFLYPRSKDSKTNYGLASIYDLFIDHDGRFLSGDDNRRVLDILATRNEQKASSSPFVVTCHRKRQPGKKTMELLVERVVNCENVQDCYRACEHEKAFDCKGFNYRPETNRSNGLCELTATPYFRMNLDKDFIIDSLYDYYEKDQNCFRSMRNGGTFREQIQPSIPWSQTEQKNTNNDIFRQQSISSGLPLYQTLYPTSQESSENFHDNKHGRFDKQFSQESLREFAFHRNAPSNYWYGDGRSSGSSVNDKSFYDSRIDYNKGFSNERSSVSPVYRLDDQSLQHDSFYSRGKEHSSDKLYNYGGAFGYSENHVPSSKEYPFEEQGKTPATQRCSIRFATGSKLGRNVLRKSYLARDLKHCEQLCNIETTFTCGSFAYRYNVLSTNPSDNCLLSDLLYQDLNSYTDLEPDRDYDIYVVIQDSKICLLEKTTTRYPSEECFSRVRSGFGIPTDITRKSTFAHNLGECQFACTMSQEFICKSFVFVYGTIKYHEERAPEHVHPNCFLSDSPSREINPVNMPDMDGAELYERSSFPNGCETYRSVASVSDTTALYEKESVPARSDELCYTRYHRPCKLMPHAIVSSTRAPTKSECRRECSLMRNTGTTTCMSFNYMITGDSAQENCLLSDISIQDLRPNFDYTYDHDHMLYTWKDLEPFCGLPMNALYEINVAPILEEQGQPLPPTLSQSNPQDMFNSKTHSTGTIFHSDSRARNKSKPKTYGRYYERNYEETDNYGVVDSGEPQSPLSVDSYEHEFDFLHSRMLSAFRRYTVNGHPCKNGTVCQRNEIAGFWSCELDGTEYGDWDYCCELNHRCGFSQGYHYPWCYVGSNYDQWRPCSETYYPYNLTRDRSFHRQSPVYSARHWPVIYQHDTLPPNCTISDFTEKRSYRD
ncbi:PREDICTED: uncharacterized protein LOC107188529 [Dufourea novaeangliae]|uniref:uncharacterized protein LOC107188529 n=1 Tax=Dufourea novaeangliae TaxID=178035 RepID=UPI0007672552|nr:PREDICTED: uncharacterized protein LOC107188529 [Dufourea novaeangliae]